MEMNDTTKPHTPGWLHGNLNKRMYPNSSPTAKTWRDHDRSELFTKFPSSGWEGHTPAKKQNKRISGHTNSIQQFIEGNRMMLMYLTWLIMQQIDAYTTRYQQSTEWKSQPRAQKHPHENQIFKLKYRYFDLIVKWKVPNPRDWLESWT